MDPVRPRRPRIWLALDAAGREAITRAAAAIDAELADSAYTVGEGRFGNVRVHHVPPLGLNFEVDVVARSARILNVWLVK